MKNSPPAENHLAPELQFTKLLIIGPAWVGDMVIAQSLFRLIKQRQPATIIDVLAPAWSQPLLARMPEVRQAWLAPFKHGELKISQRLRLAKQLRAAGYQQAIVLPNSLKAALIPLLAGIPRRTGWLGELRWGLLNDVRYRPKAWPLLMQRFAALGLKRNVLLPADLPMPRLRVADATLQQALERLGLPFPTKPLLALCPGAEYGPAKRWPVEHFAAVARHYLAQGWEVWLFGSAHDQPLADSIQHLTQQRCVNLAGKTTLDEAIDLLSLTTAVICNDSGLMHIAAALEKPVVAIYGSSSPAFTPPLTAKAQILSLQLACSPCFERTCPLQHLRCLRELPPSSVIQALQTLVPAKPTPPVLPPLAAAG